MEQIVRVKQTHDNGTATVFRLRESACSGDCHKCSGCGTARETLVFQAENPIGAARGDLVVVASETAPVMRAAAVFYVAPLVLFFLGYFLGGHFGEIWGAVAGGVGFFAAVAMAVLYDRKIAGKEKTIYTITGFAGENLTQFQKKGDNSLD